MKESLKMVAYRPISAHFEHFGATNFRDDTPKFTRIPPKWPPPGGQNASENVLETQNKMRTRKAGTAYCPSSRFVSGTFEKISPGPPTPVFGAPNPRISPMSVCTCAGATFGVGVIRMFRIWIERPRNVRITRSGHPMPTPDRRHVPETIIWAVISPPFHFTFPSKSAPCPPWWPNWLGEWVLTF